MTQTWTVSGMTCDHCVASVTEEVAELPGVRRCRGRPRGQRSPLPVDAEPPLSDDLVREASREAGYRLV